MGEARKKAMPDIACCLLSAGSFRADRALATVDLEERSQEVQHRAETIWARAEKNF